LKRYLRSILDRLLFRARWTAKRAIVSESDDRSATTAGGSKSRDRFDVLKINLGGLVPDQIIENFVNLRAFVSLW
jgi:hypothetical protein